MSVNWLILLLLIFFLFLVLVLVLVLVLLLLRRRRRRRLLLLLPSGAAIITILMTMLRSHGICVFPYDQHFGLNSLAERWTLRDL